MKKLLIAVLVLVALDSLFGEALPWKSDGEAASPPSGVLPEEEAQPAQTPEEVRERKLEEPTKAPLTGGRETAIIISAV